MRAREAQVEQVEIHRAERAAQEQSFKFLLLSARAVAAVAAEATHNTPEDRAGIMVQEEAAVVKTLAAEMLVRLGHKVSSS
jgi:hypothetical protein